MPAKEFSEHQRRQASRAHISWVDRVEYAVRSRGAKVVVLALLANTMVAQLLYTSARSTSRSLSERTPAWEEISKTTCRSLQLTWSR
jgi:hypothetical protein